MQYKVACANRETGAEFIVLISAESDREALNTAMKQGHMVVSAVRMEAPAPQPAAFDDRRILVELQSLTQAVQKNGKRQIRAIDVAAGVCVGMFFFAVGCLIVSIFFSSVIAAAIRGH